MLLHPVLPIEASSSSRFWFSSSSLISPSNKQSWLGRVVEEKTQQSWCMLKSLRCNAKGNEKFLNLCSPRLSIRTKTKILAKLDWRDNRARLLCASRGHSRNGRSRDCEATIRRWTPNLAGMRCDRRSGNFRCNFSTAFLICNRRFFWLWLFRSPFVPARHLITGGEKKSGFVRKGKRSN